METLGVVGAKQIYLIPPSPPLGPDCRKAPGAGGSATAI